MLTTTTRRVLLALACASAAGVAASGVDAAWAGTEGAPSWFAVARSDAGLLAPVALVWGAAVAVFGLLLAPGDASLVAASWRALDVADAGARRRAAALAVTTGPVVVLWATAVAHVARAVMASVAPGSTGALTLTVMTALLAALAAVLIVGTSELLAGAMRRRAVRPSPRAAAVSGTALASGLFAWGIAQGDTGGQNGWLGIWGVLKRAELDLRAPALLVAIAAFTLLAAGALRRVPGWCAVLAALLPLALTYRASASLDNEPGVAAAIERGAPLGHVSLAALRSLSDRDSDGASAWFGGGDCDDRRADVNPSALDVPGNGVDEDCSGVDAVVQARVVNEPPAREPRAPARRGADRALPTGLNVLLITIDTLRADLGYAGNPKPLSPNLDALAARAVVFERAYSLASYTGKSVGPLMIGKYPSETHRNWGHFNRFNKDTMLAERLRARGIRTIGMQAHWYFSVASGLGRGFDVWDETAEPPPGPSDTDTNVTGGALTNAALRQLGKPENTGRRFFAWMHYVDPHAAYVRHDGAPDLGTGMRAAYDGEVWYTDSQIGRVLRFIGEQPWGANTAIVVTSDHGEAFGEHHMIRHGFELWEELVRVPLLVYLPGVPAQRVAARRSAIDLVPTLLDLFEMPAVVDSGDEFVSGRSLVEDLLASPGSEHAPRDVFIDMPAGPNNDERRAFIRGDHKLYVSNGVRLQLFDLAHDPGERTDLATDKALLAQKRAEYQAFRSTLREVVVKAQPRPE